MTCPSFAELSYQAQVYRLRRVADQALRLFPLRADSMRLLFHGENTTFRVWDRRGRQFVLRLNVRGYHSTRNVREELEFLETARAQGLSVPEPVRSKGGQLVEELPCDLLGHRAQATLFRWISGRLVAGAVSSDCARQLGELLGQIHSVPFRGYRRKYWDAEQLLGENAFFGATEEIEPLTKRERCWVADARQILLKEVLAYQRGKSSRTGYLHGDLHTHNVLWSGGRLAPIDFDDCGRGLLMHDVAVTLGAVRHRAERAEKDWRSMRDALLRAYADLRPLEQADEGILTPLIAARGFNVTSWLYLRRDNPNLTLFFKKMVPWVVDTSKQIVRGRYAPDGVRWRPL